MLYVCVSAAIWQRLYSGRALDSLRALQCEFKISERLQVSRKHSSVDCDEASLREDLELSSRPNSHILRLSPNPMRGRITSVYIRPRFQSSPSSESAKTLYSSSTTGRSECIEDEYSISPFTYLPTYLPYLMRGRTRLDMKEEPGS